MAERAEAFGPLIDPDHVPFLSPGDMVAKIDKFCRRDQTAGAGSRGEYVRHVWTAWR